MKRFSSIFISLLLVLSLAVPVLADDGAGDSHQHEWSSWATEYAATCTTDGSQVRYCTVDGCNETEHQALPALGHSWTDWTVAAAATVFGDGLQQQTCTRCGAANTAALAKLSPYAAWAAKVSKLPLKQKYTFVVDLANGDYVKKWKSSKKKVATVSKSGVVKAKKRGTTIITAYTASGKKISCKVKVVKAKKKAKKKSKGGTVYWTPSGSVYHYSRGCRSLARSCTVYSGTIEESGMPRACKNCG